MAGNPFRRPPNGHELDPDGPAREPKKKVKKVQFVSPVATPREPPSHPRFPSLEELDDGPRSPPPKGSEFDSIDMAALLRGDLTAGGTIDLAMNEQLHDASSENTPTTPTALPFTLKSPPPGRKALPSRKGPPPNPFARTLATMDNKPAAMEEDSAATKKPAMDVDAFKRLLLTGQTEVMGSTESIEHEVTGEEPRADAKRPVQQAHVANRVVDPVVRDSSSESDSTMSETDEDGSATSALSPTAEATSDVDRVKPIPTSSSSSSANSFDDFEADLEPSIEETTPAMAKTNLAGIEVNAEPEDKPSLPAALPLPASTIDNAPSNGNQHTSTTHAEARKHHLPAPPPPSTRRRGNAPNLPRGGSASKNDVVVPPSPRELPSIPSGKPRPPAPRSLSGPTTNRDADTRSSSHSRASSSVDSLSVPETTTDGLAADMSTPTTPTPVPSIPEAPTSSNVPPLDAPTLDAPMPAAKAKPPPPPARTAHRPSANSLRRTPSTSSTTSQRRTSPATAASNVPPPPPPPRRGEAKHSLATDAATVPDLRRLSGGSHGSHRRDSISSLQRVTEEEATASSQPEDAKGVQPSTSEHSTSRNGGDMLADLDAFQREVDALRKRALAGK